MAVHVQNFNHWLLAEALGEFEKENVSTTVRIAPTPDIISLLAMGALDAGAIGLNAGALNAINVGADLNWVSGFTTIQPTDQAGLYVRDDWVEDPESFDMTTLRGARIGINVGGRASQSILDLQYALEKDGVGLDEVEIVELQSSDFGTAMATRAVDAVDAVSVQQIRDQGTGVQVSGIAPITAGGYFLSDELVSQDREVGLAVMRALVRTQCEHLQGNYYDDPVVLDALVEILQIPEERVLSQSPLSFELKIAPGSLEQLEQVWKEQGVLEYEGSLDPEELIDESLYIDVVENAR